MKTFNGRTAVITGGASGIGLGLAERFAAEGMNLLLADIEVPALEKAEASLSRRGINVTSFVCDVSNGPEVDDLADLAPLASPVFFFRHHTRKILSLLLQLIRL